jgi:hypothetical protein
MMSSRAPKTRDVNPVYDQYRCWYCHQHGQARKITVEVDENLLRRAQKQAREGGVTGTVRRGLQILAATDAYEKLARLRGKVKFSTTLTTMRNDRR